MAAAQEAETSETRSLLLGIREELANLVQRQSNLEQSQRDIQQSQRDIQQRVFDLERGAPFSVSFSSATEGQYMEFCDREGLLFDEALLMRTDFEDRATNVVRVDPFQWRDDGELAHEAEYLHHVRQLLRLPSDYVWVKGGKSNAHLLNCTTLKNSSLKGNVDVFATSQAAMAGTGPHLDISLMFELKKEGVRLSTWLACLPRWLWYALWPCLWPVTPHLHSGSSRNRHAGAERAVRVQCCLNITLKRSCRLSRAAQSLRGDGRQRQCWFSPIFRHPGGFTGSLDVLCTRGPPATES